MRFDRFYQFNRISENFSSDNILSVHLYPTYAGRFDVVSFFISKNMAFFQTEETNFRVAFYEYLLSNCSIGISKQKQGFDISYQTVMDFETLVSNTCRSFTENELVNVFGGRNDFVIFQPENRKHLGFGKFRTQIDVLIYSYCFRTKKNISDIVKSLPNFDPLAIYRSALILSLLGFLKIEEINPIEMNGHERPVNDMQIKSPQITDSVSPQIIKQESLQSNALKRLFTKIMSI